MKIKLKNKWIKALRSGKYRQVQTKLGNKGKGRCCLGVLCDIERYKFIHFSSNIDEGGQNKLVYGKIDQLIGSNNRCTLEDKNDSGVSFKKIAYWIKGHL